MKKHIAKIGGALIVASVLVVLGFKAQRAFGQAAVAYPNFTQATAQQPTIATNIQIATIAVNGGGVLSVNQVTNIPTGIVADTNALIITSNPFSIAGASASNVSLSTNNLSVWGVSSNGVVFVSIANFGTNKMTIPQALMKVKVESWQ